MQWDEGAYKQYADGSRVSDVVGDCLVSMNSQGLSNSRCLQDYLGTLDGGNDAGVYFEYEKRSTAVADAQPDACIVFTGPARHQSAVISTKFLSCVQSYSPMVQTSCSNVLSPSSMGICEIPHMIWSGGSKNNVPVALNHVVDEVTSVK